MRRNPVTLPIELRRIQQTIEEYARGYELDFFDVLFEVIDWRQMNEIAALGGFPNRYPHWRFGMEYERLSKSYAYGLSKIYEMVINNDPCYAYLLHSNHLIDQKLVMAHVYAHCDFFKNNAFFARTNRKMMDEMANHRTRVLRYIDRCGIDRVEAVIDAALSIDNLIDYHGPMRQRAPTRATEREDEEESRLVVRKIPGKPYMERFINPPEFIEAERRKLEDEIKRAKQFPERPERDVMGFLLEYAPLEGWERDLISIVREEAYYFSPQGQTKVLNEGWASYWHSKMMTQKILTDADVIDYADHHSGTVAMHPGQINPYKIGLELFRDIEDRWNRGRFGKEYDECEDMVKRAKWDTDAGIGRQKIFEVRKLYNDVMFIDEYLTPEFCRAHKLFVYAYNAAADQYEIQDRAFDKIKRQMLFELTNFGYPIIVVSDANYGNRGELLLKHEHEGVDLREDYARETLKGLVKLWRRPVGIETLVDGAPKVLLYDGEQYQTK
ncbi:MAG: SpoVR family protein [Deltaproteobacteria bacterium]|nr:SpoVR family protein [Deltaproteobacteria bacterium]